MATKADIMSDYYRMPKTKAGVLADYGKLTRLANDRLREIEKRAATDGLTSLTQYAYKRAVHDLQGATRFASKEKIENLNYNAIVKRMNDMRRFLRSKSSTTRGVKSMYSQNASRFNKKYGTNFTQEEYDKIWDFYGNNPDIAEYFPSEEIIYAGEFAKQNNIPFNRFIEIIKEASQEAAGRGLNRQEAAQILWNKLDLEAATKQAYDAGVFEEEFYD